MLDYKKNNKKENCGFRWIDNWDMYLSIWWGSKNHRITNVLYFWMLRNKTFLSTQKNSRENKEENHDSFPQEISCSQLNKCKWRREENIFGVQLGDDENGGKIQCGMSLPKEETFCCSSQNLVWAFFPTDFEWWPGPWTPIYFLWTMPIHSFFRFLQNCAALGENIVV